MKMTFERSVLIALVGCLAIAVAVLPADGAHNAPSWMDLRTRSPEDMWGTRMRARAVHFSQLAGTYKRTFELNEARHTFGSTPGKIGAPEVHFAADVPQSFRVAFTRALDDERAAQGAWTAHGKVGVYVLLDTSTRVNGVALERLRGTWNGTYTRVVPPSAATGDRCVTVVSIPNGDPWSRLFEGTPIGPMHPLLDACGFYDAFGAPGVRVENELVGARYQFARGYQPVVPQDTAKHPSEFYWGNGSEGTHLGRCLAGADTMCVDLWLGANSGRYSNYDDEDSDQLRRTRWDGITYTEAPWRTVRFITPLSRAALAVGPQRFEKIWQSPKTIEAAYFDETGQTLAAFIRADAAVQFGSYRAGPYTPWFSTAITLFAVAAALGAALRFSPRPKIA